MTETTKELLARLTGFKLGPYTAEFDDDTWITSISMQDGTLLANVVGVSSLDCGLWVESMDKVADLFAASPDLHRICGEQADRIEELEAKLDRISDAWSSAVYSDLENGVASLNTRAAEDFAKRYPSISAFGGELLDTILEGESE